MNDEVTDERPPVPPIGLDAVAQAKWDQLVTLVWEHGWNPGTAVALAIYCTNWFLWRAAEVELARAGPVIKSPSGYGIQNPHLGVSRRAQDELRKWGRIVGVTGPRRQIEFED